MGGHALSRKHSRICRNRVSSSPMTIEAAALSVIPSRVSYMHSALRGDCWGEKW